MKRRETASGCPVGLGWGGNPINWGPMPECLGRFTGFALAWVSELNRQIFTGAMAELGLHTMHPAILVLLLAEGPMVQARISDRLRIDRATMVGLLNELEAQGLIERRPHPTDRRAFEVHVTEAGEQRTEAVARAGKAVNEQFYGVLTEEERRVFLSLLQRLATANSSRIPFTPDASDGDTEK
jgi:MarR family transcriptional regulator, lower aerobic nicotinate degradation pathway regulator